MRQVILGISESPRAFCSPCRKISGLDRPSAVMLSKVRTRTHREAVLCYSMPRTTCSRLVNGHLHRYRKNNYWKVIVVSSPVPPVQGDDVKLHFVSILMLGDFPLFTKRPGIVNLLFSSEVKLPWNILLLRENERGNALNSVPFMKRIQMIDLCSSASNSLTLFCHWNQEEWRDIGQLRSSSFFQDYSTIDCDFTFTTLSFFSWGISLCAYLSYLFHRENRPYPLICFCLLVNLTVELLCSFAQCQSLREHVLEYLLTATFQLKI